MEQIVVYGCGGHAMSVVSVIEETKSWNLVGLVDDGTSRESLLGHDVLGDRRCLADLLRSGTRGAHVAIGHNPTRREVADTLVSMGFSLVSVIHPSAVLLKVGHLGAGAFVHAFAVIGAGACIGDCTIVSAHATVAHGSVLGRAVHLAPGARLSGNVEIGDHTFVGTGAAVLPGVRIGRNVTVGANAVVTEDVRDGATVVGIPARPRARKRPAPT